MRGGELLAASGLVGALVAATVVAGCGGKSTTDAALSGGSGATPAAGGTSAATGGSPSVGGTTPFSGGAAAQGGALAELTGPEPTVPAKAAPECGCASNEYYVEVIGDGDTQVLTAPHTIGDCSVPEGTLDGSGELTPSLSLFACGSGGACIEFPGRYADRTGELWRVSPVTRVYPSEECTRCTQSGEYHAWATREGREPMVLRGRFRVCVDDAASL